MTSVFEKDIHEKTLEAWVQLNDLNQKGSGSDRNTVNQRRHFRYNRLWRKDTPCMDGRQ